MEMRMEIQLLSPGMKDKDNARCSSHMLLIPAQSKQRIGSTGKHEVVKKLLIFKNKVIQLMWNRKNGMVISTFFNQFRIPCQDPFLFLRRLTVRAVSVVTGTGMDFNMSTFFTEADVVTK